MRTRLKCTKYKQIDLWEGHQDCDDAHEAILAEFLKFVETAQLVSANKKINKSQKGNIGEFICYRLGKIHYYSGSEYRSYPANAHFPLSRISKPEFDIVWILFAKNEKNDCMILQEVKTTGKANLAIANKLVEDYKKLFDTDPNFTLSSRIQAIKNALTEGEHRPDLARRLNKFLATKPQQCSNCIIVPSLVHEKKKANPKQKLSEIEPKLRALGWDQGKIRFVSVALTKLETRLLHIARGK